MAESTEYWETIKVLHTHEIPASSFRGTPLAARLAVTFQVLESNKSFRVSDVHTVTVKGEYITRVLAAQAMGARLVAHTATDWRIGREFTRFYPIEHPQENKP